MREIVADTDAPVEERRHLGAHVVERRRVCEVARRDAGDVRAVVGDRLINGHVARVDLTAVIVYYAHLCRGGVAVCARESSQSRRFIAIIQSQSRVDSDFG